MTILDEVPNEIKQVFVEMIRELALIFFQTFEKSNVKNTKKPASLVKIMINYGQNWLNSKDKQKIKSDSLVNLIRQVSDEKRGKAYKRLVVLNLLSILTKHGFLNFSQDRKEVSYEEQRIVSFSKSSIGQLVVDQEVNYKFYLMDNEDFEKDPVKTFQTLQNSNPTTSMKPY